MARMAQGVVSAFDEAFSFACPKFVTPGGPPRGATKAPATPPTTTRRRTGRNSNVSSRRFLPARSSRTLRSLLKLYTSISVPKLADLMEISPEQLREQLEVLRRKSTVTEWRGRNGARWTASRCLSPIWR